MDPLSGARRLIDQVLGRKKRPEPATLPSVASQFPESGPPIPIRQAARDNGDVWRMGRLLMFSVTANFVLAGLIFTMTHLVKSRPPQMIEFRGDLREQIRAHYAFAGVRKDNIVLYLTQTLPLRYAITPAGAPYVILLQGQVSGEIYADTRKTMQTYMQAVQTQGISQSLIIEEVGSIDFDEKREQLSAVVKGKIQSQALRTASEEPMAKLVEYRALVVLDHVPTSELNRFGFFMVGLREATGKAAAAKFDREMKDRYERTRGDS